MQKKENLSAWITGLVESFLAESPLNNLQTEDNAPAWDDALVGFASGADPIFQEYKEYIGPFHWTPLEIYNQYHPQSLATRRNSRSYPGFYPNENLSGI